jgi:DNA invertase Pin-like site-specific DNA recombinase
MPTIPSRSLPTQRPVAVYYRQSRPSQVGNISTAMQQEDLPRYLQRLGWAPDQIIILDQDGGVSGALPIEQRPGMAELYRLITTEQVGAVAATHEDRFFRDETMIEVNRFIEACRLSDVWVITGDTRYDFNNPVLGRSYIDIFRQKAEQAADFKYDFVHQRLLRSRAARVRQGRWDSARTPSGYMVDTRLRLPGGQLNPNYRRFVPFPPYAEVVRRYFDLFWQYDGNTMATWKHILRNGPFFPELIPIMRIGVM